MKFLALLVISLQMLVAPVCQAALSCDEVKQGPSVRASMDGHSDHAMTEGREASSCDACDEAILVADTKYPQVLSICFDDEVFVSAAFNFDPTGNQVSSFGFAENDFLSDNQGKPTRLESILSQDIWLRTLRIRV